MHTHTRTKPPERTWNKLWRKNNLHQKTCVVFLSLLTEQLLYKMRINNEFICNDPWNVFTELMIQRQEREQSQCSRRAEDVWKNSIPLEFLMKTARKEPLQLSCNSPKNTHDKMSYWQGDESILELIGWQIHWRTGRHQGRLSVRGKSGKKPDLKIDVER